MRDQDLTNQNGPSDSDAQISHLLSSLPRVDAPGDFGFRVKARIAARRQVHGRRSWLPASAAVAAPLGLALAVGGYFVMTTAYSPSTVQAPQVADLRPASLPTQEISSPAVQAEPTFEAVIPREEVDDRAVPMRPREIEPGTASARVRSTASLRKTNGNSAGISEDQAVGISEEVPPKAVDANRGTLPEPPNMNGNTPVSAKSVLSRIGIEASFSGSAWTVGSVRAGSAAANAGLKAGDVIEAVNGRPLTGTSSFDSKFTGRTLRIRRDGKTISIALKN